MNFYEQFLKINNFHDSKEKIMTITIILTVLAKEAFEIPNFIARNEFIVDSAKFVIWLKCEAEIFIDLPDNFRLIIERDKSIYEAWNQALDVIENETSRDFWVCFVGLDDRLESEFFLSFSRHERKENSNFYFGNGSFESPAGLRRTEVACNPLLFSNTSTPEWDIFHPGAIQHSSIFEGQRFTTQYKLAGDFEFYLRVSRLRRISYQKLDVNQVVTSMTGVSNHAAAKLVYIREIREIELTYGVSILKRSIYIEKLKAFLLMSRFGNLIRKIYWQLKP